MKNLKNLNLQELTIQEQIKTDGALAMNVTTATIGHLGDKHTGATEQDKKDIYVAFGSGF